MKQHSPRSTQQAQVLPDMDLASKEVSYSHCIGGAQQLLFYKVFAKMHRLGSRTPEFENKIILWLGNRVTRLGDLLDFVQLFKAIGNN